jgi:hypothetical protein
MRIPTLYRLILAGVIAIAAFTLPAHAAGDDESSPQYSRSDSLELPGLTAGCHICEWRPKLNQKPAAEQCGTDDSGVAKVGLFECGFSQDCERLCHFLRCGTN